jgi:signal transduction histidine kinase
MRGGESAEIADGPMQRIRAFVIAALLLPFPASAAEALRPLTPATVAFEIPPTFFQSRWFLALGILLALVPLWLLHRLRVAQVTRALSRDFNVRLDERVNEQTRIARELHDRLLQGFQGLMLRFQSARDLLPAHPADALEALDGALDRADQAIAEGRDAIQNLRSSTSASNELAQATYDARELLVRIGDDGTSKDSPDER